MNIFRNSLSILIILTISLASLNAFGKTKLTQEDANKALRRLHIPFDEQSFYDAIYNNDIAIVDLFLLSGMSPNTKFSSKYKGITPLIIASYNNNNEMIKLLIENGANISYMYHIKDNEERSALYFAIENLNYKICKLLLEKGASTYFIHNNKMYKGKDLLDRMIEKKEYASSTEGKLKSMDQQAKETALNILGLLKKYSDNDLLTFTGKIYLRPKGWTFEPGDKVSKTEEYRLGEKLPDILKEILEQAKNQNADVTIIGEPDQEGYLYIDKIGINGKLQSIPNYRGSK